MHFHRNMAADLFNPLWARNNYFYTEATITEMDSVSHRVNRISPTFHVAGVFLKRILTPPRGSFAPSTVAYVTSQFKLKELKLHVATSVETCLITWLVALSIHVWNMKKKTIQTTHTHWYMLLGNKLKEKKNLRNDITTLDSHRKDRLARDLSTHSWVKHTHTHSHTHTLSKFTC